MKLIFPTTLAVCFAGLSAAFWLIELEGQAFQAIALAVVASIVVSGLTFVCAYYIRSVSLVLILPVIIFGAADTYQNAMGYQALMSLTVSDEAAPLKSRINEIQARYDDLAATTNEEVCKGHGPLNCAERKDGLKTDRQTAKDDLKAAQAELEILQTPTAPIEIVGLVMLAIQIALALTFALFGKTERKIKEKADPAELPGNVLRMAPRPQMDAQAQKAWDKIAK